MSSLTGGRPLPDREMFRVANVASVAVITLLTFIVFWMWFPLRAPGIEGSFGVRLWWTALSTLGVANLAIWVISARVVSARRSSLSSEVFAARQRLLWFGLIYLLGCAFRSLWLRTDGPRICIVDTWVSSIVVGRTVATVAEMFFAAQWAILLREYSLAAELRAGVFVSRLILPLIAAAEVFSWYAIVTTYALSHAVEESLWTISALLVLLCIVPLRQRASAELRPLMTMSIVFGLGYLAFMSSVDVPMYVTRWLADEASGHVYQSIPEGLRDISQHWRVTLQWSDWRPQMPWMSLYFSFAVWASIAFAHAPVFKLRKETAAAPQ